jgi:acetylglutamate kinase
MCRILIKIGGSMVNNDKFLSEMAAGVSDLLKNQCLVSIVHGGGKDINEELARLNKEFKFVDGQRVTDVETMFAVQRVLSGDVNKRIVNEFLKNGINAVGISGVDANTTTAKKLFSDKGNDLGLVGEIVNVNTKLLDVLSKNGFVAVISPVSRDDSGNIYNVNADGAASEIAVAQKVDDLIFVSDVGGVKIRGKVAQKIKICEIEKFIEAGEITGGMIPKLHGAAQAINRGVKRVHICGWYGEKTLSNETGENSTGTTVC